MDSQEHLFLCKPRPISRPPQKAAGEVDWPAGPRSLAVFSGFSLSPHSCRLRLTELENRCGYFLRGPSREAKAMARLLLVGFCQTWPPAGQQRTTSGQLYSHKYPPLL